MRGFVGMVFFFFVASAITGIGCVGAFAGCVAVMNNASNERIKEKCTLPERSGDPIAVQVVEEPVEEKPKKPARRKKAQETKEEKAADGFQHPMSDDEEAILRQLLGQEPPPSVKEEDGSLPPTVLPDSDSI